MGAPRGDSASKEAEAAGKLASGQAWDEFCDALKQAGRIVLERSPDSEIDRAEGFRYLTRLTRMGLRLSLEHADPAAPELIRYMDPTQKFGIDNPDQLYQWARISGEYDYRLSGPRGSVGYVGIGVYAGSIRRGGRRIVAHLRADDLEIGPDGRISLTLSPRAPEPGHANWIQTAPDTTTLLVRQTVNDAEREKFADLTLERIGADAPPPPLSSKRVVRGLSGTALQVSGSAQLFADLSDQWAAQPNVLHPSDEEKARDSFGDPDLYYMGGYWKVAPDEALVIDFTPPVCHYWGFVLCNYWTESLEYRYRPVCTNGHRASKRADGSVRLVVAHRDPGLPDANWIDTEGHGEGTMTLRWLLAETTPVPTPRLVKLAELGGA